MSIWWTPLLQRVSTKFGYLTGLLCEVSNRVSADLDSFES